MLKVRLQGTKDNLNWFSEWLLECPQIKVIQISDMYSNKGTNRYYRMYAEIEKVEIKEDKSSPNMELGFCSAKQEED